nr:MAG TPA: hypothetical protein [Caudoviricetes sp.]
MFFNKFYIILSTIQKNMCGNIADLWQQSCLSCVGKVMELT